MITKLTKTIYDFIINTLILGPLLFAIYAFTKLNVFTIIFLVGLVFFSLAAISKMTNSMIPESGMKMTAPGIRNEDKIQANLSMAMVQQAWINDQLSQAEPASLSHERPKGYFLYQRSGFSLALYGLLLMAIGYSQLL